MITQAGVAVFLFGNKNSAGKIVSADGMEEEFHIAVQKKLFLVPVACTGSMGAIQGAEGRNRHSLSSSIGRTTLSMNAISLAEMPYFA